MGYQYYFNVHSLYFIKDFQTILVNDFAYRLMTKPIEEDGHVLIPVKDFMTIYAKAYDMEIQGGTFLVASGIRTARIGIRSVDGFDMVAADRILAEVFDYRRYDKQTVENNCVTLLTCDGQIEAIPKLKLKYIDALVRGKRAGDLYETFWFEEGQRLVPYRIYLPTSYDGVRKLPVVFVLHGGNGSPNSSFQRCGNQLQYYAEQDGMIVVGVDGFIKDATYGYIFPPNPGAPCIDYGCPENPAHHSKERLRGHRLGELCLEQTIRQVLGRYAADPECMFLMGNSMGGEGTFWFASTHPKMFKAICPAGAMVNTRLMNLETLKGLPILFVGGTEDMHGFDYLRDGVDVMKTFGLNIRSLYIGGGDHPTAWTVGLKETFDFFRACR